MTLTEKRKRAAIIAVSYFLQSDNKSADLLHDSWSRMGITRMMYDTEMLLRRGKTPGINNY